MKTASIRIVLSTIILLFVSDYTLAQDLEIRENGSLVYVKLFTSAPAPYNYAWYRLDTVLYLGSNDSAYEKKPNKKLIQVVTPFTSGNSINYSYNELLPLLNRTRFIPLTIKFKGPPVPPRGRYVFVNAEAILQVRNATGSSIGPNTSIYFRPPNNNNFREKIFVNESVEHVIDALSE